ncbi:MAG: glycoside hydrolase family 3 C-terminal domain-containing protein [Bacteroidota bacterium]|jgi:beta-glucosidase
MSKELIILMVLVLGITFLYSLSRSQSVAKKPERFQPLSFEEADAKAASILALMTTEEKIAYIGGDRSFFLRSIPRLNLDEVYMTDATQGVHIREEFRDNDLSRYQLEKSTAFPCPLALAATWNTTLANQYATAAGEECRGGGIGILLGPGVNNYRISQCGRNFEYFGEDPFLTSRIIEAYVKGVQSTGTVATLKHFVANNTEFYRRKSNSIVDERTLHEICLPPFKAGIDAGAHAVMTSYNLLNGEWCGESDYVINNLLRKQLGFKWLVMTDWWSVYNGEKVVKSGQDLEMPQAIALKNVQTLLKEGKVNIENINRMVKSILRTYYAMKLSDQKKNLPDSAMYDDHEAIALQTAREGIVLLKNDSNLLPLKDNLRKILLTGEYVEKLAKGGGSAEVKGFNHRLMLDELKAEFGQRLIYRKNPSIEQIKSADVVLCNVGTEDSEGWDRAFALPKDQEKRVLNCVNNNPNTIVIVTSGSGIRMTDWNDKAKAILYAWYGGQIGNKALAEILSGKVNPSGKLPITIEKEFKDSPGYGYMPAGEILYNDWNGKQENAHPVYDVNYKEGVFVGYRWYESKKIEPLYPFGYGLSFTVFDYSNLTVSKETINENDTLKVGLTVKNSGSKKGMEIIQVYVEDVESSVPRPVKELKAFKKVELNNGETVLIQFELNKQVFAFWNPKTQDWYIEKGKFVIHVGAASNDIRLSKEIMIR